jgi:LPS sulfotransferase NodH
MEMDARERFKCRQLLEVVYEDLSADPTAGFQRISDFLELTDVDPGKSILKKQNPESVKDLIINFSEVAQALVGTPYEEYLNT